MEHAVEMILVPLHTSVLFIGLVDFLLSINKTVARVLLVYIVPLAPVYIATMLLPRFFSNSHYFISSSSGSWKVSQLDNRRPRSQPSFRHPPYIEENTWRDDGEHRDHHVAVAHNASHYHSQVLVQGRVAEKYRAQN